MKPSVFNSSFLKRLLIVLLVIMPMRAFAQYRKAWPISIGIYANSNNVWTHDVVQLATWAANIPLTQLTGRKATRDFAVFNLHYISLRDNGDEVDYKIANPYGFKAYDLFNNIDLGLRIGWNGPELFGIYVYGGYGINQYKLRFLGDRDYEKHIIQNWKLGLCMNLDFSKLFWQTLEWGVAPFVEIGTTYVYNFKYKGPNDNDITQIENGMRTNYAFGIYIHGFGTLLAKYDMAHYNLFNKSYTPDGGFWYPYANTKSKDMTFFLGFRTTW